MNSMPSLFIALIAICLSSVVGRGTKIARSASKKTKKDMTENVNHSFSIFKASKIFNYLPVTTFIRLTNGHRILLIEELKKCEYYKWHKSRTHSTTNCVVFRNTIQ